MYSPWEASAQQHRVRACSGAARAKAAFYRTLDSSGIAVSDGSTQEFVSSELLELCRFQLASWKRALGFAYKLVQTAHRSKLAALVPATCPLYGGDARFQRAHDLCRAVASLRRGQMRLCFLCGFHAIACKRGPTHYRSDCISTG